MLGGFIDSGPPPELIGAFEASTVGGASSIGVTLPSGFSTGDRLFIQMSGEAGGALTVTTPSGWTALYNETVGGSLRFVALFTKISDGSEGSTQTITFSAATNVAANAWAVTGSIANCEVSARITGNSSGGVNSPSLTPAANGRLWFVLMGSNGFGTITEPSGWSLGIKTQQSTNTNSSVAYKSEDIASQSPGPWGLPTTFNYSTATIAIW